jgi:hypothetical protein
VKAVERKSPYAEAIHIANQHEATEIKKFKPFLSKCTTK